MKFNFWHEIALSILSVFLVQCFDQTGINDQDAQDVRLNYHQSVGCIENNALAKTNDQPQIKWNYLAGYLKLEFTLSTLCSAEIKDSVVANDGTIDIFLRDTNPIGTLCTCPFKEIFSFYISNPGKLKASFYFKQYVPKEYHLEADTTIYLN